MQTGQSIFAAIIVVFPHFGHGFIGSGLGIVGILAPLHASKVDIR